MSNTEKIGGRRVWSSGFISRFESLSVEERFEGLVEGFEEAGFKKQGYRTYSPLSKVIDLLVEGVLVRLYLVELRSGRVICYSVGVEGRMNNENAEIIFRLEEGTVWTDIRIIWERLKL